MTRDRWRPWRRNHLGSEADRATFRTLHNASLASPALREGLTARSAERSSRHLRALLGSPAVALTDTREVLHWDGLGGHHRHQVATGIGAVVDSGRTRVLPRGDLSCEDAGCPVRDECLDYALADPSLQGVWGGRTDAERRVLRHRAA